MGSSKKVTVGFKYYIGAHFTVAHRVEAITKISIDDKEAWSGSNSGGTININQPELFGGESREGGVVGAIDVLLGSSTQPKNNYLMAKLGAVIPAFRGVTSLVLKQVYIGLNPYLKNWSVTAIRQNIKTDGSPQWNPTRAAIARGMNPAHIIRECLTDPSWGMGGLEIDVDETSFIQSAQTLYDEGFALQILWDTQVELTEFIQIILDHIDGSLFVSNTTGKYILKLTRGGYDIDSLLVLDEASITSVQGFQRKTVAELTNQITVVYHNPNTGKDDTITVNDPALALDQGATIGTKIQYNGVTNPVLAEKLASRDLLALSVPIASCTLYATRKASALSVGDVFVWSYPQYGIVRMVMRISNMERGMLDNNQIKIDCVEDVFALPSSIFAPVPPSGWINPAQPPSAVVFPLVFESPYYEIAQQLGDSGAAALDQDSGYVSATAVRPTDSEINFLIYSNTGASFEQTGVGVFCPSVLISMDVSTLQTVMPFVGAVDLDQIQLGVYAFLGSEIVRVDAVTVFNVTLGRGCLDTVPVAHAAGTRIYFVDGFDESDQIEYVTGMTAQLKLLPVTSLGALDLGSAAIQSVVMSQRQFRPYPPGQFKINGEAYPSLVLGTSEDVVISWAHRDRLQQTAAIIDTTAGNIGPEVGTTYSVVLRDSTDIVIATETGIVGTSSTINSVDLGAYYGEIRVQLWSTRDGVESMQMHEWIINREISST